MTPAILLELARALLPLAAGVWFEGGQPCNATIVQSADVCEAHIVGACEMTRARCLESNVYVSESEEPAIALGCSNEALPRVIVIDCEEVPRP
jgi:hypothetical protein